MCAGHHKFLGEFPLEPNQKETHERVSTSPPHQLLENSEEIWTTIFKLASANHLKRDLPESVCKHKKGEFFKATALKHNPA
jgi:hypothetical protein